MQVAMMRWCKRQRRMSHKGVMMKLKAPVFLALMTMYFVWGSTYLAIRFALESLPPLLLTALRLLVAGGLLFGFLAWRGKTLPTRLEWRNAAIVGGLMLAGGVGSTTFAEQWVDSGLTAVLIATVPLWATLLAAIWERKPSGLEWIGVLVGFGGVLLLNSEATLRANWLGTLLLLLAPISWALGSVLSRRLTLPLGPMAFAAEMLAGGGMLLVMGLLRGERIVAVPTLPSALAWLYLTLFGSLLAFSAYMYLLQTVSVTLATSYAYVNPAIAVLLGVLFAGERLSPMGMAGVGVILTAVVLISVAQRVPNVKPAAKLEATMLADQK